MAPRLVVINHWGGVPTALHRNAVVDLRNQIPESREWYTHYSIPLSRFDPACSFRECLLCEDRVDELCLIPTAPDHNRSCLLYSFAAAGYRVVVLGASGIDVGRKMDVPSTTHRSEGLSDPTESMKDWGVDTCSLYDGAYFRGAAFAHDRQVLREAHQWIEEHDESIPLLLWINLLSCKDVYDLRFRPKVELSSKDGFVIPRPPVALDPRVHPLQPDESLKTWLNSLNEEDSARYGEKAHDGDVKREVRDSVTGNITSLQYATLLDYSWDALRTLHGPLGTLVTQCLTTSELVVTASHAMSLGESGTRVAGPFGVNAHTFWTSTVDLVPASSPSPPGLSSLFVRLAGTLGVTHTTLARPVPTRCMGIVLGQQLTARVECRLNDHVYECVLVWPITLPKTGGITHLSTEFQLLSVYVKGIEHYNVFNDIPHLLDELKLRLKRSLPTHAQLPAIPAFPEQVTTTTHSTQTKDRVMEDDEQGRPSTTDNRVVRDQNFWSSSRLPSSDPIPIPSPRTRHTVRPSTQPLVKASSPAPPPPIHVPYSEPVHSSSNPFESRYPLVQEDPRTSPDMFRHEVYQETHHDEDTSSVASSHNMAALVRARSGRNTVRSVEASFGRRVR